MTIRAQRRLSGACLEPLCSPTDAFTELLQEVEDEIFMQHNENYELDLVVIGKAISSNKNVRRHSFTPLEFEPLNRVDVSAKTDFNSEYWEEVRFSIYIVAQYLYIYIYIYICRTFLLIAGFSCHFIFNLRLNAI